MFSVNTTKSSIGQVSFSHSLVVPFSLDLVSNRLPICEPQRANRRSAPFGWLADRTSHRQASFLVGLFILAAATILLGVAATPGILVLSRILQGLSCAVVYTVGLALLVDTVDRKQIGQALGTALSGTSVGILISPLLASVVLCMRKRGTSLSSEWSLRSYF